MHSEKILCNILALEKNQRPFLINLKILNVEK